MSPDASWFAAQESAAPAARWPGMRSPPLPIQAEPASRLWIPGPLARAARTVAGGGSTVESARGLALGIAVESAQEVAPIGVAVQRAGTLQPLAPVEEAVLRGSVSLAAVFPFGDATYLAERRGAPTAGGEPSARALQQLPDADPLARRLAALLQPPAEHLLRYNGPIEWPRPFLPYQLAGIRELLARDRLLLADDMGLGKTVQTIAALRILVVQRRIESALVMVPAGLLSQWRTELRLWAPELRVSTVHGGPDDRRWQWRTPAHLYLTSYETLRADFTENPHAPVARLWDLVVLDEAQKIKNAGTDLSRVCKRLKRRRQWALSGTPLENSSDDLASLLDFVNPGWDRLHRPPITQADLRVELSSVQLRRRKADVLHDLPRKLVSSVVLPLTPPQRLIYDRVEREGIDELRARGASVGVQHVLALIVRLKQICNFSPASGDSSKLDDLRERLSILSDEGYKALVFTQFANADNGARAIAARLGSAALVYAGDMSPGERDRVLQQFRTVPERKVLVLSLRAGGQGLNLQEASYVFHFDRWWNPAVEGQAEARSHRMGQQHPVNVYTYTCANTIEERIEQMLRDKQLLFDELVDDVSLDLSASLTSEELFGLFDLQAPATAQEPPSRRALPTHYASMSGAEFQRHVQHLLERRGWRVQAMPGSRDGGIDLVATRSDDLGVEVALYVQCKNHVSPVGVEVVRALNGAMRQQPGTRGVVVCPSGFTADARAFAQDRGIALWDRHRLFTLEAE